MKMSAQILGSGQERIPSRRSDTPPDLGLSDAHGSTMSSPKSLQALSKTFRPKSSMVESSPRAAR